MAKLSKLSVCRSRHAGPRLLNVDSDLVERDGLHMVKDLGSEVKGTVGGTKGSPVIETVN